MREIKFRGKRIDNGEWVYGYLYSYIRDDNKQKEYCILQDTKSLTTDFKTHYVDPATIGQLTGFHDINKTEIYEGDLVREKSFAYALEIVWDIEECGFMARSVMTHMCYSINNKFKIIGNIHDNPELLGETP